MKFLILALSVIGTHSQNVDDAIRDLYMKVDSLEQENMDIHRELDFLENEVTVRAHQDSETLTETLSYRL